MHRLHHHPVSPLPLSKVIIEGETRHEAEASRRSREGERERDGRERYLPETKANRSISRSAFLFEGASISVILKSHFIELENSPLEV